MGYANLREEKRRAEDAARIKELESQLKRELAKRDEKPITNEDTPAGHVVIERTSKKLKGQMLVAWLLIIAGIIISAGGTPIGGVFLTIGIILFIVTKITIWWRHG